MNWVRALSDSINYIEEHLTEELKVSDIAKVAMASPFYYQRMFYLLTGTNVQEYIRNRRVSKAAAELIASDIKVIDLAFKYGYESSEAFSRAFKKVQGVNPTAVRKSLASIKVFPKLTIQLTVKGDVAMDYKIEKKQGFSYYGMKRTISTIDGVNFVDIPKYWDEVLNNGTFTEMLGKTNASKSLGVCLPMSLEEDSKFDYLIGAFTTKEQSGYYNQTVPEAEWAIFEVRGPIGAAEKLQNTWKRIFSEWFPSTGFKHADLPQLEVYSEGDVTAEDYLVEIWIPIEKN